MSNRLTDEQIAKIVAEVSRLSQRDEFDGELDVEQVKEVLADLNLSPDLLDEALVQLQRREALATQQRRRRWLGLGAALVVVGAIALMGFNRWQYQQLVDRVGVVQARITLPQDDGGTMQQVNRQRSPEVYYRVTLSDAPVNRKLSLACAWKTPTGEAIRENRYQTQRITTATWNTHCRNQLGPASPAGTWSVEMFLGDRSLSRANFAVK